ncbi:hypothetical protein QQF64_020097 [Cirrhinus molitorella]|uniref:Uncharacterized protein n=1 Tax=Cirrhinus molitorella TaxID=172907 RepID=A0ABR3LJT7_9TELE
MAAPIVTQKPSTRYRKQLQQNTDETTVEQGEKDEAGSSNSTDSMDKYWGLKDVMKCKQEQMLPNVL